MPVDLVTLDLNMPGLQGEELMRVIRREFPRVEVIVITGYGSVESAVEALRFGICDYIQKPFDVVKVLSAVGRGLSNASGPPLAHRLPRAPRRAPRPRRGGAARSSSRSSAARACSGASAT